MLSIARDSLIRTTKFLQSKFTEDLQKNIYIFNLAS